MTYALVLNNSIQSIGQLPASARRIDTGEWVMGLLSADKNLVEQTGWFEIVESQRPSDTATTIYERSVDLINGVPTEVWTARQKTQTEIDSETEDQNRATIETAVRNHMATLNTLINTTGNLSSANLSSAVRTLATGQKKLIRLLLNEVKAVD